MVLIMNRPLLPVRACILPDLVWRQSVHPVPLLVLWLYCFNTYVAVQTSDELTLQILSYSRLIVCKALHHDGSGWVEYGRVFHCQMSINPTLCWNTLDPRPQAVTIIGHHSSPRHILHPVQRIKPSGTQVCSGPSTTIVFYASYLTQSIPRAPGITRPPKHPDTLWKICVDWNKGIGPVLHAPFTISVLPTSYSTGHRIVLPCLRAWTTDFQQFSGCSALQPFPQNSMDNSCSNIQFSLHPYVTISDHYHFSDRLMSDNFRLCCVTTFPRNIAITVCIQMFHFHSSTCYYFSLLLFFH